MIKSLEEYEKIEHQFEKERKTEKEHEFLEYLKDGRLEKLITIWNSEKKWTDRSFRYCKS